MIKMRLNFNTKKIKTLIPFGNSERKRGGETEQVGRGLKNSHFHIEPKFQTKKHFPRGNINSLKTQIKANILRTKHINRREVFY